MVRRAQRAVAARRRFAGEGFPLVGGRLDVIAGKPVPALVYRRREHVINVFVLPGSQGDLDLTSSRRGYSLRHWNEGDLGFWAVSDAAPAELVQFERAFRTATSGYRPRPEMTFLGERGAAVRDNQERPPFARARFSK